MSVQKPTVQHQCRFTSEGEIKTDEFAASDLSDWGLVEDEPEQESRIEVEAASSFGVDDRSEVRSSQADSEQDSLFVDVDDDQVTLGGGSAAEQSKW